MNPFDGWYTQEKAVYDEYIRQGLTQGAIKNDPVKYKQVGHYLNIIDPSYERTGAAFELNGESSYSGICSGQVFDFNRSVSARAYNSGSTMSVSELKKMVDEFCEEKGYTPPAQGGMGDLTDLPSDLIAMRRLYNPNSGEHFYTADFFETLTLLYAGWKDEGIGWIAPRQSNTPVYRLYNKNAGDHHYTMDKKERDVLISVGWKDEGIGWYSDDFHSQPLYRQYNPNAKSGSHNYTTDMKEHRFLIQNGWKDEGIAWYAAA